MKKNVLNVALLAGVLVLSGCGLFGKKDRPAASTTAGSGASSSGYNSETPPGPVEIGGEAGGAGGDNTGAPPVSGQAQLNEHIVYFEFDSSELTAAGRKIVAAYAQYLSSNPSTKLRLQGHADERGTREYNVGLGERRANVVQQALVASGASASQLSVTSYGEERPADPGHSEAAWAKNRRVEIVR